MRYSELFELETLYTNSYIVQIKIVQISYNQFFQSISKFFVYDSTITIARFSWKINQKLKKLLTIITMLNRIISCLTMLHIFFQRSFHRKMHASVFRNTSKFRRLSIEHVRSISKEDGAGGLIVVFCFAIQRIFATYVWKWNRNSPRFWYLRVVCINHADLWYITKNYFCIAE